MRLFNTKSQVIELIIATIFCYVLAVEHDIRCPGPDAYLYRGLSVNLVTDTGYVDTIRNDYILPPIGHPLVLSIFQEIDFDDDIDVIKYLCFLSLVVTYLLCSVLQFNAYFKFFAVFFLNYFLPGLTEWGIEVSLVFSILLFWFALCCFFVYKNKRTAFFLGLALFINLLIRPILAPLFYSAIIAGFIALIINRRRFKREAIALAICALLFFGVRGYSVMKYDDSRMVSGTYSEITLYCAYNEYIPLDKEYRSTHWRALPNALREDAMAVFDLKTTWQDRAALLRKKTMEFISEHPEDAWKGFKWRLNRYTINQESKYGAELFYIWLFLIPFFVGNLKKSTFLKLLVAGLPLYVVLVMSVFPYIDIRYALTPNLFFICSILTMISFLDSKQLITLNKVFPKNKDG